MFIKIISVFINYHEYYDAKKVNLSAGWQYYSQYTKNTERVLLYVKRGEHIIKVACVFHEDICTLADELAKLSIVA